MNRRGTTLVELLISIAVLVVVGFLVAAMYITTERVRKSEATGSTVQLENIFGQQRLRDALNDAASIATTVTIGGTTYTTGAQTLIFKVPSIDAGGDIIANTWDTSVVTLTGTPPTAHLVLLVEPDAASSRASATKILATSVDDLRIRYDSVSGTSSTKVSVTLRTLQTISGATRRFTTDTVTTLRNS
jgi:hypothetical protein